ncbi:hypothetical protein C8R44DRAFT_746627 [Mycena epipterygia]|nr:hypothetical protein C8R44DRAFT_746627 [Mycena epipterygia]
MQINVLAIPPEVGLIIFSTNLASEVRYICGRRLEFLKEKEKKKKELRCTAARTRRGRRSFMPASNNSQHEEIPMEMGGDLREVLDDGRDAGRGPLTVGYQFLALARKFWRKQEIDQRKSGFSATDANVPAGKGRLALLQIGKKVPRSSLFFAPINGESL